MSRVVSLGWVGLVLGVWSMAACTCEDDGHSSTGADDDDGETAEPWLLAIDEDESTIDALIQISVEPGAEGEVSVVCPDLELPSDFDPDTNFTSLAYHDGILYASAARETWGDTLMRIDPCACTATMVGTYGFALASGLASSGDGLFGIAAEEDLLITIDPATANAEQWAVLAQDWGSHGLTSMGPNDDSLYGLDATSDRLYRFAGANRVAFESVAASEDFASVGLEFHPGREQLYACGLRDRGTALATIDRESGLVEVVAESVFTTDCDNLAGPSGPMDCIE